METLVFRSLTVVSDGQVDLIFEADDGDTVTFRFRVDDSAVGPVTNGPPEYQKAYRMVPGPAFPTWYEQVAAAAWRAHHAPLPAGRRLEEIKAEVYAELKRSWNQRQQVNRMTEE